MGTLAKTCTACKQSKPVTAFRSRGGKYKHLLKSVCNPCLYTAHKEWTLNNPDRVQEYRKKDPWTLAKRCVRRGISPEELVSTYEAQGKACAICCGAVDLMDSAIDHNHATNEFRGVLCKTCNRALGMFRDNPAILRRAVEYLETKGHYGDGTESPAEVAS